MARLIAIFTAPEKGAPMQPVLRIMASREFGLAGDRYGRGEGSWSTPGKTHRQVSLIELEAMSLIPNFRPDETRRNLLTAGLDLNSLVGKRFRFARWGGAVLLGTKLCDPCQRPAILAGKPDEDFAGALQNRGGLCAEVVEDGEICAGDDIVVIEEEQ